MFTPSLENASDFLQKLRIFVELFTSRNFIVLDLVFYSTQVRTCGFIFSFSVHSNSGSLTTARQRTRTVLVSIFCNCGFRHKNIIILARIVQLLGRNLQLGNGNSDMRKNKVLKKLFSLTYILLFGCRIYI